MLYLLRLPARDTGTVADMTSFKTIRGGRGSGRGRGITRMELRNTHEWARAIESGTEEHEIPKGRLVGGLAMKYTKDYLKNISGFDPSDKGINLERRSWRSKARYDKAAGMEELKSTTRGYQSSRTKHIWVSKDQIMKRALAGDPTTKYAITHRKTGKIRRETRTKYDIQQSIAHETVHSIMDRWIQLQRARGVDIKTYQEERGERELQALNAGLVEGTGEWRKHVYWDHPEENFARYVADIIGRKVKYGREKGSMTITEWLPSRGGGKGSEAPGFGVKYVTDRKTFPSGVTVSHPGARAFKVFEHTKDYINANLKQWLDEIVSSILARTVGTAGSRGMGSARPPPR